MVKFFSLKIIKAGRIIMNSIGQRIKNLRRQKPMSQALLAELIGVDRRTVINKEKISDANEYLDYLIEYYEKSIKRFQEN